MKKQMKLRDTILITIILICSGIVLCLGWVSNRQFTKTLTRRMVDDYSEALSVMEHNVQTLRTYAEDFAKYMALDDKVIDTIQRWGTIPEDAVLERLSMRSDWNEYSVRLLYSTSMLFGLDLYAGEEQVYSYYDSMSHEPSEKIPPEILRAAREQSAPLWTELLTLGKHRSYTKRPDYGFAVVKSVRKYPAKQIGTIAVYVRESSFSEILSAIDHQGKCRSYLVNGEGTILSAVDKSELYRDIRSVLDLSQEDYQSCIDEGTLLKEQKGETPVLYAGRAIEGSDIYLVSEAAMVELRQQRIESGLFTLVLMAIAIGLAFFGAWFASDRVTKPLNELMDIMEQMGSKGSRLRFPEGDTSEIGILGSRFNELMDRLDESAKQIYNEQRQRRHNEVRLLQAQIEPHFLYNTMGVISSFIKLNMPGEALTTIQNLVSFYRLSLSSGKEIIPIRKEVELTRNYMELQQLRYIEYMDYTIEWDEAAADFRIPKLTIQPLVENVLRHGLKANGEKCHIQIRISYKAHTMVVSVHDNGAGMTPERLEEVRRSLTTGQEMTTSFGVLNIYQRLRLMYGDKFHMEVNSIQGEFTEFILYLRQNTDNGEVEHV